MVLWIIALLLFLILLRLWPKLGLTIIATASIKFQKRNALPAADQHHGDDAPETASVAAAVDPNDELPALALLKSDSQRLAGRAGDLARDVDTWRLDPDSGALAGGLRPRRSLNEQASKQQAKSPAPRSDHVSHGKTWNR